MDLATIDDGWLDVRAARADGEDDPTREEVLDLIRAYGVPPDLGEYVASLLERKRSRGAPAKKRKDRVKENFVRALNLQFRIDGELERLAQAGAPRGSARRIAIENVARSETPKRLSADTVKDIIKQAKKDIRDGLLRPRVLAWFWPGRPIRTRSVQNVSGRARRS